MEEAGASYPSPLSRSIETPLKSSLFANAGEPGEYPTDGLPEVAVMGRSNAGKSSFINALTGRRQLARTSGRPGKTRRLHFYRLDDAAYLVDLPGYGYAAVAKSERATWRPMVEAYLRGSREPIRGAILVADLRRGVEREELELLRWLDSEGIPGKLVFTKRDRVRPGQVAAHLRRATDNIEIAPGDVIAVSSTKGTALGTVATWIHGWTGLQLTRPDGSAWKAG